MSDFLREIEEDIREERILILWRKYGNYLIGLALAIVIGTAGYTFWNYVKHKRQLESYASFTRAVRLMDHGKKEEALQSFQELVARGGGYGKLSQLYEGALQANPEDTYKKIAEQNASDPALGNLPKVLSAARGMDKPDVLSSLESLTAPHNAWAPLALELLAFADLKKGDQVKAAENYIKILNESYATLNERSRAGLMLSQMDIPAHLLQGELDQEEAPQ